MKNSRLFKILAPDTRIHIVIIAILIVLVSMYNHIIGIIGIFVLSYLIYYNLKTTNIRREEWTQYIEGLSSDIDSATKQSILNMPIPLTMVEIDGGIKWYNKTFMDVVGTQGILEKDIQDIVPGFDLRRLLSEDRKIKKEACINNRNFEILYNIIQLGASSPDNYAIMLYWIENTEFKALREKTDEEKMVVALIQIDNFDEVMQGTEDANKPLVIAKIDHMLSLWANRINAITKKYDNDKFIIIFQRQYLEKIEAKKFGILDEMREVSVGNTIPITLSIGIGTGGNNPLENFDFANGAKDLSLGRGGDQATVKNKDKISFYGGKTNAIEKKTKVKARVIAYALRQLIEQCDQVLIMGHKHADLDVLGSALGIYRAAANRNKEAYIIISEINSSINCFYEKIVQKDEYKNRIITCNEARERINENSLVVVVDTQRPSFTECPELLNQTDKVVVIDHHRRSREFIENTALTYHETYASSTSEMVTEILSYIDEKINIEPIEAEALLAGIVVDTKNFTFKTGVRTFEAAALLRRAGADTTSVKELFQDNLDMVLAKAEVIKRAEVIRGVIAISSYDISTGDTQLITSQAADELLDIRGMRASFVLGRKDDTIIISGRSMGDINVQIILEKLGGGGHLTVAGAQLEGIGMEEARSRLGRLLEEYFDEGGD